MDLQSTAFDQTSLNPLNNFYIIPIISNLGNPFFEINLYLVVATQIKTVFIGSFVDNFRRSIDPHGYPQAYPYMVLAR